MKTIADRVRELEQRVAALEQVRPAPAAPPPVRAEPERARPAPEVEIVSRAPRPVRPQAPPPSPPRPSLEVGFGRWMSRLGGLALVVAAGFLFAYAAKQGWLTPSLRVVFGLAAGLALVAAGEWQQTKLRSYSAALTGAGLGVLYVSVYAGYAFLDFFSDFGALALGVAITAGGAVQALRHDTEAVAGLAAAGGFLAPVIVRDFHAQPLAVLGYVSVLNVGLALLRARKGWLSPEILAWVGTPCVAALPLARVALGPGLGFLLFTAALFGVRPRLRGASFFSVAYTLALSALTAGVSFVLFEHHGARGWPLFAGGLAAVLAAAAWLQAGRVRALGAADLYAAAGFAALALLDGLAGWHETLGWSALALALLLPPWPELRAEARRAGAIVALLAAVHLLAVEAWVVDDRLFAFLAAGAAVGAIGTRLARWGGVLLAALGLAAQVAALRGADPWLAVLLLSRETAVPSTRLLAGGTLAALALAYAVLRGPEGARRGAAVYGGLLLVAEGLYLVDGRGVMPLGLVAAGAFLLLPAQLRSVWTVAGALALAVAADLVPPPGYVPFLNRRAFALGAVLGAGWLALRRRPEARACSFLLVLLAAAEVASVPDRAGGLTPWRHLFLDLRAPVGILPFLNARFLFLAGAVAASFLAARRWRLFAVAGHLYAVVALGAEAVGLAQPAMRATFWPIFLAPSSAMAPHLALTGVILGYGAALVTAGILRGAPLARRIGLGLLLAGGLKVSIFDLAALGDLYRVGSFLLLGVTYLLGSYAYNRWVTPEDAGGSGGPASGPEGGA